MKNFIIFISLFAFFSCSNQSSEKKSTEKAKSSISLKYAKLFKISKYGNYTELIVLSKNEETGTSYFLIPKGEKVPKHLINENIIFTPVERIICLSTTHIAYFDILKKINKIVGVSGAYVYNEQINKSLKNGEKKDVGYEQSLDYETIISLKPDLLTIYNIDGNNSSILNKLKALKIPVVSINEYSEPHILGQTEWIKFFAEFVNETGRASQIFDSISNNYSELKNISKKESHKPTVLLNMPWKGVWYIPGNNSNIAQLISDAGGVFFGGNNLTERNFPTDVANVYINAGKSDIWLNPGQAETYSDIENIDKRLTKFRAYKNRSIFNRNRRLSESGGNDFMESGVVHPDIILKDIIKIFHPDLLPNHEFFYYKSLL